MVLSGLALSILGLFRYMRQAATSGSSSSATSRAPHRHIAASSPSSSDMEVISLREDDRVALQPSSQSSRIMHAPVVGTGLVGIVGERERAADRGLMAARAQALLSPSSLRSTSSKRKLEEFEIGMVDLSVSAISQVQARREAREVVQEGSIAESSGRERYEAGGAIGAAEAESFNGETEMREEDGNAALDDDNTWDERPSRIGGISLEGVCESSKEPPDKIDEVNKMDASSGVDMINDDHGSSLQVFLGGPTVVVDFGSSPYSLSAASSTTHSSLSTVSLITSGLNGVDVFEAERIDVGRNGEDDAFAGRGDLEVGKEAAELDGLRERDMERDGVIEGEEESVRGGYGSSNTVASVPGESICSSACMGFQNLSSSSLSSLASGSSVGRNSNEVTAKVGTGSATPMELSPTRLQFFVRAFAHTIVLQAYGSDLVESVHQQILLKTGLPISEQRLIFGRLQLQQDQTLESCHVANDATLTLVARMRSTALPASWQLINDLVSTIRHMCAVGDQQGQLGLKLMHSQDCVRASVQEFLKMAVKSVPASEHMQVFELAGATCALVMLLLSPVESNRECAEDSINLFLAANDEYLPAHIHCYCASVLLDFCKLLAKSAPSHNLYASCRQSLARLLDTVGVAHGSLYFNEAKADSIVEDFAPFVNELSSRLITNLRVTARAYQNKEMTISFSSYVKEAKDFTAFVIPLCKAMEVCKGIEASGSGSNKKESTCVVCECMDDKDGAANSGGLQAGETSCKIRADCDHSRNRAAGVGAEIGSHGWLRQLFKDLLQQVDSCLKEVGHVAERQQESAGGGTTSEDRPFGWAPFLVVLKGLHAVAKLYKGAMVDLLEMLRVRCISLNILIKQSRWQDDDFWLLDHKTLLDFESKRRLGMAMLPEPQGDVGVQLYGQLYT